MPADLRYLTEDERDLVGMVREFSEEVALPAAAGYEERSEDPAALYKQIADLGLTGIPYPEEYGGGGQPYATYLLVVEEIARVSRNSAIVAVEVPIRTASAADRVVFDGVDALLASFQPYVGELFLKEDQPARSATNAQGTDVARVVFSLAADRGR